MCCVVVGAAVCSAVRVAEHLLQFEDIIHLDLLLFINFEKKKRKTENTAVLTGTTC